MEQMNFKNKMNGFTAVELVIGLALAAMVGAGAYSLNNFVSKSIVATRDNQSATRAKRDIVNVLATASLWQNVLSKANSPHPTIAGAILNPELVCIQNGTACTPGTYHLSVFDNNNNFFTDTANAKLGFSLNSGACQTFDPSAQGGPCPMRYETDWTPICPPAASGKPCINPSVRVTLRLIKNTNAEVAVALTNTKATATTNVQETTTTMIVPNPSAQPLTTQPAIVKNDNRKTIHDCVAAAHTVNINLDQDVYHSDDGEEKDDDYTISLPTSTTANGGTLTLVGHRVVYTLPDASATGVTSDDFNFTVKKNSDGKTSTAQVLIALDSGTTCDSGDGSGDGKGDD